jgi:uncharacterized protein involved in exopolysaccharide biosynthesis
MTSNIQQNGQRQPGFFDSLSILLKWRRFIVSTVAVIALVTVAIVFIVPKWYKATASIIPPKEQDLLGSMGVSSSLLRNIPGLPRIGGLGGSKFGAYNYLAILKSRSAMEAVVKKFHLIEVYNVSENSMEKAIKELEGNTSFEIQNEDYISIEVYDTDPVRAADMANYFVEVLNDISIKLGTQEARNNREFIERRVQQTRQDLRLAEDTLRAFQEKSGILIAPQENSSGLSAIAELYAMKAKKEIEAGILERTVSKDNPILKQLQLELSEVNKKVDQIPEAGIGSLRLYREVAIQQKILEFLIPMYEQAKVDEKKDVPVLLVLDKAVPAERKAKPQRLLIVLVVTFVGLFLTIALTLWMNNLLLRKDALIPMEDKLQSKVKRLVAFYKVEVDS